MAVIAAASVLYTTLGFLVRKARDHTAEGLRGGDLTDEQCRQFIIGELEDIKTKIDGLARKDLLASIDFLEQGMRFFKLAREEPSEDQTATMAPGQQAGPTNQACALLLSQEMKRLKITSNERYAKGLRYFEESENEATRAFNNEALSIADRLLATRLRMVSVILQNIQDPDVAIDGCRLYLEKLNKLPAIQKMFAVHLSGGLKARLNKRGRTETVISVTMLNHVLYDFERKFGQTGTGLERLFNWPTIQIGEVSYNPLITHGKISSEMDRSAETSPVNASAALFRTFSIKCWSSISAVTSDRKILATKNWFNHEVFLFDISGDGERVFWSLPEKDTKKSNCGVAVQAVLTDEKDNVFVAYRIFISGTYVYKLVCLDLNGNVQSDSTLEFLGNFGVSAKYAVTKDGKLLFIHSYPYIYVCDSKSGVLKNTPRDSPVIFSADISLTDTNQIIMAGKRKEKNTVLVVSLDGNIVREIKFPGATNHYNDFTVRSAFIHVTKDILVMTEKFEGSSWDIICTLFKVPQNSDRPERVDMMSFKGGLIRCHPSGPVALISDDSVLFLQ